MKLSTKWKQLDKGTKGCELDTKLISLFGDRKFVTIAVNRERQKFIATDKDVTRLPDGYQLFSAGCVGGFRGEV